VPPAAADSHLEYKLTTVKEDRLMEAQRISAQNIKQRMKNGDYFVFIDTCNPGNPVARKEGNGNKQDAVF